MRTARAQDTEYRSGSPYRDRSDVEALFGLGVRSELAGKVVIDFGCGPGAEAIEVARFGSAR